ncbi:hypothetical protein GMMP15_210001 [Candidatus Magnetomoraceae bacterium gMMP-15]
MIPNCTTSVIKYADAIHDQLQSNKLKVVAETEASNFEFKTIARII